MSDNETVSDSPLGEDGQTPTPLLSKREAAAHLGVSEKTIERYVHEYGLLQPAREDPRTGGKQFDPSDIERLRLAPPGRRKTGLDSPRQSDLPLRELVLAMQQAHAETVRAKNETIIALHEQVDSLRQSHQQQLSATVNEADTLRLSLSVLEAERDDLRRQLAEGQSAPPAAPQPPRAAPPPDAATATPEAPGAAGSFWARVRRAFGGEE